MFSQRMLVVLLLCFNSSLSIAVDGRVPNIAEQGKIFLEARHALKKGQVHRYQLLAKKLPAYPLYAYLEFDDLKKNLSKKSTKSIEKFLHIYADYPLADRLRRLWLPLLAKEKNWDAFFKEYEKLENDGTALKCYYAQGLFSTGKYEEAMQATERLWVVGKSQPKVCDPIFERWESRGGKTATHIWQRIELAMAKGRLGLVKFLAKPLPKADQHWVKNWRDMHAKPAHMLAQQRFKKKSLRVRKMVRHGIKRLARRDAGAAAITWSSVRQQHLIDGDETVQEVDRYVALRGSYQQHPDAVDWLSRLSVTSKKIRSWRIRAALAQQDWWSALTWIDALPDKERAQDKWQYWRARILEQQSKTLPELSARAERIYLDLAQQRSYYGFMAADRMQRDYQWEYQPLNYSAADLTNVAQRPGIIRALELYRLRLHTDARREWRYAIASMNIEELRKVSVVADQHGWHDRAIATVAKGEHFDDIELRFPVAHREQIQRGADENGIESAWVYGIVRQESIFMADARSHAGALGLMQLMPQTGRLTARKLKTRLRSNKDLLNISKNIRLGTSYLKRMLDKNNGNSVLATASYNAGPYRVKKWLPEQPLEADLWVVAIPYDETRRYVRRVMAYTVIYNYRLGNKLTRMQTRMLMVHPFNS